MARFKVVYVVTVEADDEEQAIVQAIVQAVVGHSVFPQAKQGNSDESKFWTPALAGLEVGV